MKLKSYSQWPPGGWLYFEPKTQWREPDPAGSSFEVVAGHIAKMRTNNKRFFSGEDCTMDAARRALSDYTVARLLKEGLDYLVVSEEGLPLNAPLVTQSTVPAGGGCKTCGARRRK